MFHESAFHSDASMDQCRPPQTYFRNLDLFWSLIQAYFPGNMNPTHPVRYKNVEVFHLASCFSSFGFSGDGEALEMGLV